MKKEKKRVNKYGELFLLLNGEGSFTIKYNMYNLTIYCIHNAQHKRKEGNFMPLKVRGDPFYRFHTSIHSKLYSANLQLMYPPVQGDHNPNYIPL